MFFFSNRENQNHERISRSRATTTSEWKTFSYSLPMLFPLFALSHFINYLGSFSFDDFSLNLNVFWVFNHALRGWWLTTNDRINVPAKTPLNDWFNGFSLPIRDWTSFIRFLSLGLSEACCVATEGIDVSSMWEIGHTSRNIGWYLSYICSDTTSLRSVLNVSDFLAAASNRYAWWWKAVRVSRNRMLYYYDNYSYELLNNLPFRKPNVLYHHSRVYFNEPHIPAIRKQSML